MALKVGELYAALSLTKDQFDKGLSSARSGAKKWASNVGSTFKSAGKLIAAGLAIGIAAIAVIAKEAMGNAVEQERATARVRAAYGKQTDAIEEWVQASSKAWGINDDTLEISVAKYGDWAKNVGMSTNEAMKGGEAMAERAAQISLATGKDFQQVFDGLFKGQQGMIRGLKEYGVAIDQVALTTEALRLGLIKEGEAMDAATQARARGSLIMQQTTQFTGIAADMTDSLALKQRQMGAIVDTVMDTIGAGVLNVATAVMPVLVDIFQTFADWVVANMPAIQAVAETVLNGLAAAFKIVGDAITWLVDTILPPLQEAFNWITNDGKNMEPILAAVGAVIMMIVVPAVVALVTSLGPLLLAVGAVIAIVAVLVKAWQEDWGGIRTTLMQVWKALEPIFQTVVKWLGETIPKVVDALVPVFRTIFGAIGTIIDVWVKAIGVAFAVIGEAVRILGVAFENLKKGIKAVWDGIGAIIKGAINGIIGLINGVISAINGIQVHVSIDAPDPIPDIKFDWGGLNIPKLGYLAKGTPNWRGGWAVVGEQGPELARLPKGTQVFNAGQTRDMMEGQGGGGSAPPITQHIYGAQPGDVERETKRALRRQALDWALEGRT